MTVVVAVAEEKDWRFGIFFSLLWTAGGGGCLWLWLRKKIGDLSFFFPYCGLVVVVVVVVVAVVDGRGGCR